MAETSTTPGASIVRSSEGTLIAEIWVTPAWVYSSTRVFDSSLDAEKFIRSLERHMIAQGLYDVIVDAREQTRAARDASETMWRWVAESNQLRRMALVNNSEHLALAVRMKNLASPVKKVAPFKSLVEAENWLRSKG